MNITTIIIELLIMFLAVFLRVKRYNGLAETNQKGK